MQKLLFLFFIIFISNIYSKDVLTIVFEERIPYVEKDNSSLKGLVALPFIKALNKAKIDYILKEKPSKRHLYEIKSNIIAMCAIGWFKNKDREKYSKYTNFAYEDKPLGIIAKKTSYNIFSNISIDNLLKNKNLNLLTKASYSYGNFLDEKIKKYKVHVKEVYNDNKKMLELIAKKRADYMFISQEEAKSLLKLSTSKNLQFFKIKDIPTGNKRYLICSKKVSDKIINKINKHLKVKNDF